MMNTAQCKSFIEQTLDDPKNHVIREELVVYHEASGYTPKLWSRVTKKKIKTQDDLEDLTWAVDSIQDVLSGFPDESIWFDPAYNHGNFAGCIMRLFIHKEADCMFGIITDPGDSKIVFWGFSID